jgi:hypothetical protein
MKFSALAIAGVALTTTLAGVPALAQSTSPPVTMQPIPNPPEKTKMHGHKAKHMKKADSSAPGDK